jgi:NAD(P)-dependent dehydrogenase (short-subunit alcohol dehydrogenase family)
VTVEGWKRTVATNLTAPVFLTQAFAAALPEHEEGAVVNVTDWRTSRPYPNHFSYTVSKGAIDVLTLAAAEHFAPRIRVNAVALGAILPPPGKDSAYLQALAQEIPLQRVGDPALVADAVLHLVRNDFITGAVVRIDGGAHLR